MRREKKTGAWQVRWWEQGVTRGLWYKVLEHSLSRWLGCWYSFTVLKWWTFWPVFTDILCSSFYSFWRCSTEWDVLIIPQRINYFLRGSVSDESNINFRSKWNLPVYSEFSILSHRLWCWNSSIMWKGSHL